MVHSANLSASGASVSGFQPDRRADSHDVLFDHDLQLLALEGHSPCVSVPRRRTQDGVYVGSRLTVDSRERAPATAPASALRHEFSDGRDAGRNRALFGDQLIMLIYQLAKKKPWREYTIHTLI